MKMPFFIVGIVKERIFRVRSETGSVTFFRGSGSKLGLKWDPNPDPDSKKNSFGSTTLFRVKVE
jgi:hypothetical protein